MAGQHGGARPNSGPKKKLQKYSEEAQLELEVKFSGSFDPEINTLSPLDIILYASKAFFQEYKNNGKIMALDQSVQYATAAAPYIHARLASQTNQMNITNGIENIADADLAKIVEIAKAKRDAAKDECKH